MSVQEIEQRIKTSDSAEKMGMLFISVEKYVKENPKNAENLLSVIEKGLSEDINDPNSFKYAYLALGEIVKANPKLAEKALDLFDATLKSEKNDPDSHIGAYYGLAQIAEANQKFDEQAMDLFAQTLDSDKNNNFSYKSAKNALTGYNISNIARKNPCLAVKLLRHKEKYDVEETDVQKPQNLSLNRQKYDQYMER